jgi:hypothetical protein
MGMDYDMVLLTPRRRPDFGDNLPQPREAPSRPLPQLEEGRAARGTRSSRRRRRRRSNRNRATGSSPPVGASGQADDAGSLTRDLSVVTLTPETTTSARAAPTAGEPTPPADREVLTVGHPVPYRFSFDTPGTSAELPEPYHWSTRALLANPTSGLAGSEVDDDEEADLDYSGLRDAGAMRYFMSACDFCFSDASNDYDTDEGYDPSRECFSIERAEHGGGNQLGMPRGGNAPAPLLRLEAPAAREAAQTPAGSQDAQRNQLREMEERLGEQQEQLRQLQHDLEHGGTGQAPGARIRARDVHQRIVEDAGDEQPPIFGRASQNLAAATILLRAMPEASNTEGRRVQGEHRGLLECAVVQQAESSASRLREPASDRQAGPSQQEREVSVQAEPARDKAPAVWGRLGDNYNRREARARLEERVRRGYHPRRGGRYDSEEDRSPSPEPPGPLVFSRAIRRAPFSA